MQPWMQVVPEPAEPLASIKPTGDLTVQQGLSCKVKVLDKSPMMPAQQLALQMPDVEPEL